MVIHYWMLVPILLHAFPSLIHWLGFRLSAPYLNTCIAYLNTLSQLHIPLHALPILIHWVDSISYYIETTRLVSAVTSAASQKRVLRYPSRQPIRIEYHSFEKHPRDLAQGGRPFSALSSSRLAIAYLNTWGSSAPPPPHQLSAHSYY